MKTKNPSGCRAFTLVEIFIVAAIVFLLALIAIPNIHMAREQALRQNRLQALTFSVRAKSGSLIDLANRFGTNRVAGQAVGYGDLLIKGHEIKGDTTATNVTIVLVDSADVALLKDPMKGCPYIQATLRELLSVADMNKVPSDKLIVALGSYRLEAKKGPRTARPYPGIVLAKDGQRRLEFITKDIGDTWPPETLFAVVKTQW